MEIRLVAKGKPAPGTVKNSFKQNIKYQTHIQDIGWQDYVNSGDLSGTTGRSLRLEGIRINIENTDVKGSVEYCTHVQDIGWQDYVSNNKMSGTQGRSLRLEAIKIKLTRELANKYDIYYRVHCQNLVWMGWAKNNEAAGSAGYAYRLEAIQIVLVDKGGAAPGTTKNAFSEKTNTLYVLNSKTKVFHKPTCGIINSMSEANKIVTSDSRDVIVGCGYKACGDCKP